jgi:hypothetical protein
MTNAQAWAERLRADPSDTTAYAALKAHYESLGDLDGVAQLIAGWAGTTADDVGAAAAYVELAGLVIANRPDASEAEPYYLEALRRDPLAMDALEGISELWESRGEQSKLIELLQEHIKLMATAGAPAPLLAFVRFQIAELWGKHFNSPEQALHHYRKALELDPALTAACYEARQIHVSRGELRAAADLLEREIRSEPDVARRGALLRELGELHRDAIDDLDGAVAAYERAREAMPDDIEVAYELAALLAKRAGTLDARSAHDEQHKVAELLLGISRAVPDDEALRYLESALEHAPDHDAALSAFEELAARMGEAALLPARWVSYLGAGASGERAHARRVELARAYLASGQSEDAAFCLGPAAEARHAPAVALLEQIEGKRLRSHAPAVPETARPPARTAQPARTEPTAPPEPSARPAPPVSKASAAPVPAPVAVAAPVAASTKLEPTTETEDPYELAARVASMTPQPSVPAAGPPPPPPRAREVEAKPPPPPTRDPHPTPRTDAAAARPAAPPTELDAPEEGALEHLKRHAAALAQARRNDEAAEAYLEVFDLDASDAEAFTFLDGHYRKARANAERGRLLLESSSDEALQTATRLSRLREAASLYETRTKNLDAALVAWQRVQALEPGADDALRAIRRLLERTERWDELVAALETDLERAENADARSTLLRRLCTLHRDHRKDARGLAGALERLLELRPDDRAARDALLAAYLEVGDYRMAAELLEARADETKIKSQKLALLSQLAELYADRMADSDRAYASYQRMLELSPSEGGAIDKMIALDEASGNDDRLLATLERRVAQLPSDQAATVLSRMAAIADRKLDDAERAAAFWLRAIAAAPTDARYVDALCELYVARDRHADLAALLRERLKVERNQDSRVELFRRLARVLADQLGDHDGAAATFTKLLELREDPEALRALEQHARTRDDAEALAALLPRLLRIEPSPDRQREMLFERAALLAQRLGKPLEAIADLDQIVSFLDPHHEPSWQALAEASEQARDYAALTRALEQRLVRATEPSEQRAHAEQLARLYLDKLSDGTHAIPVLQRWAQAAPEEAEPHELLVPLLRSLRRSAELLGSLDALAQLASSASARVDYAIAAAHVLARELKQPDDAFARLGALVTNGHASAVEPLISLAKQVGEGDALYDLLERTGHVDRVLELLADRVAHSDDDAVRIACYRRTALLLVEHRADDEGAAAAYLKLLGLCEDHEALRFLHAYALRRDQPELLASVLGRLAALERDTDERLDLVLLQAQTLRTRLGRPAEGVSALARLHADRPDVVEELIACCEAAEDFPSLAATLERVLLNEHAPQERARIAERVADLCEGVLAEPVRALRALDVWAAAEPDDPVPFRRLRPLQTAAGRHGELLATLDRLSAVETQPSARVEATIAAAQLAADDLKDTDGAFERLAGLVRAAAPAADRALEALAERTGRLEDFHALLERAERHRSLAVALDKYVATVRDRDKRVALFRRIARLRGGPLDDIEGAVEAFRALLAEQEDAEALELLRTYALGRDDVDTVCDCLRRLAALETERDAKRDLLFELGHLLRARKHEPLAAVTVLREIVESIDPDFEPALDELVTASEETGDAQTLALAVERLSQREPEPERRVEHARRLVPLLLAQGATDRAIAALLRWSDVAPQDPEPREALVPLLDARSRHTEQLIQLDALAQLAATPEKRLAAIADAATLCMTRLGDPPGAFARLAASSTGTSATPAEARVEQLLRTLASEHGMLAQLEQLYEAAQRYDEIATLLRTQAERERDPAQRAELLRRCARVLAGPLSDKVGATEAYEELLRVREDREALEHLCDEARSLEDPQRLDGLLDRLAAQVEEREAKRDIWLERARLLADKLDQPGPAVALLRRLLAELDDSCVPALDELLVVAETQADYEALAYALERRLALAQGSRSQAELAQRLADVCEDALRDTPRAINALSRWAEVETGLPAPLRRLRRLLTGVSSELTALLSVLDRLAACEPDPDVRAEAQLASARLARETGDAEGALRRLAPLLLSRSGDAEVEAEALGSAHASLAKPLANLFVLRAQRTQVPAESRADWLHAARIYETQTKEPEEALEAALRALACDLNDRSVLAEIDKLAVGLRAWERLGRVYARLLQSTPRTADRIDLCLRHADLLEAHAHDPNAALERVLEVCKLDPEQEGAFLRAERLAERVGNHEALVWIEDALGRLAQDDEQRARRWIKAARAADFGLKDRELAQSYMSRVLVLTERLPGVGEDLEELARELDRKRPELGESDARRGLIRAHLELGRSAGEPFGPMLMLRASQLHSSDLQDEAACFDVLKEGAGLFPDDLDLYDALEKAGVRLKRLDALEAHLARCIQKTRDPEAKIALLERRGRLLSEHLDRPAKAADAYRELSVLKPRDASVRERLYECLHKAGRFQDLLRAYREQLEKSTTADERAALLRRTAKLWETELRNRPSAIETWRELLTIDPADAEATAALERLATRSTG